MREIKFRGKTKDGEWVYGYVDATTYKDLVVIHSEATTYEVLPETVGQYTGSEDEDGVEIFEGDIVGVHEIPFDLSAIGVVIYYPESARFLIREQNKEYPRDFSFRKHDTYKDGYCTVECESDFHVLGNVHDNPELRWNF